MGGGGASGIVTWVDDIAVSKERDKKGVVAMIKY